MATKTTTTKLVRALALSRQQNVNVARREFSAMLTPTEEFPGIPTTSPNPSSASSASLTTLSNGLTIISETASTTSTISITFPNAGSASESTSQSGAALVNKFLAFNSGSNLSTAVILRNLENAGAAPFSTVTKTSASVGYTAAKDQAIRLVPLLATNCDFAKWDVKEAQSSARVMAQNASSDLMTVVSDSIFSAAFGAQSPLGKSLYSSSSSSSSNFVGIQSFRHENYGLNGAVLAATGIDDHASFVAAVEEGLSESHVGENNVSHSPVAKSPFLGGETRVHAPSTGMAHVALAFQGPKGGSSSHLLNVIKHVIELSSGKQQSNGGGVSAYASYTSGLVGLYSSGASNDGSAVTDQLCSIMTTIPSKDVINRAKTLAKAKALLSIDGGDSSTILAGIMTDSVLECGSFGYKNVADGYDGISVEDVQAVFMKLGGSTPALAAVGDLSTVPYHGSIVTRFSS